MPTILSWFCPTTFVHHINRVSFYRAPSTMTNYINSPSSLVRDMRAETSYIVSSLPAQSTKDVSHMRYLWAIHNEKFRVKAMCSPTQCRRTLPSLPGRPCPRPIDLFETVFRRDCRRNISPWTDENKREALQNITSHVVAQHSPVVLKIRRQMPQQRGW